jgi:hypothetical protein
MTKQHLIMLNDTEEETSTEETVEEEGTEEETTTEDDTSTDENATETEGTKEDETATAERPAETPEAKVARLKRQLKQAEKDLPTDQTTTSQKSQPTRDERYDRLELKTEGITKKAEQDVVMDYASFKKVSVLDAMKSPAIKAALKEMRDKSATPNPSTRTGTGNANDVSYWVAQYKRGKLVPPEHWPKVRDALKA